MIRKKPMKFTALIIIAFLLFFSMGCQPAPSSTETADRVIIETPVVVIDQNNSTLEPYTFAESDPGFITLKGLLVVRDPTTMLPSPDDAIFLVPVGAEGEGVSGIPQFTVGEVPQADVDESTGEFVFTNIEPGKYAVVVITMGGAQIPARSMSDGNYSIITFSAEQVDQIVELGSLSLP